ncbi:hypothetical protein NQ317_002633, partial [Molorchus minor]
TPSGNFDLFIFKLKIGIILKHAVSKFQNVIVCGDLNNKKLHDLINSYQLISLVDQPTRIATNPNGTISSTSLDYIITNIDNSECKIINPGISDHFAQLFSWSAAIVKKPENPVMSRRQINESSINEFKTLFTAERMYLNKEQNSEQIFS